MLWQQHGLCSCARRQMPWPSGTLRFTVLRLRCPIGCHCRRLLRVIETEHNDPVQAMHKRLHFINCVSYMLRPTYCLLVALI